MTLEQILKKIFTEQAKEGKKIKITCCSQCHKIFANTYWVELKPHVMNDIKQDPRIAVIDKVVCPECTKNKIVLKVA